MVKGALTRFCNKGTIFALLKIKAYRESLPLSRSPSAYCGNRSNLDQIGQMALKCDLPPVVVPLLMLQLPAFEAATDGAL